MRKDDFVNVIMRTTKCSEHQASKCYDEMIKVMRAHIILGNSVHLINLGVIYTAKSAIKESYYNVATKQHVNEATGGNTLIKFKPSSKFKNELQGKDKNGRN